MEYLLVKWVHILSATLLFGTGLGSAFYKWMADRSGSLPAITHTNRIVVLADWWFTMPTIVIQPVTGFWLMHLTGLSLGESWIVAAVVLYLIAGACWLPVVWLQIRMRDLAADAAKNDARLDARYWRYARMWCWLGVPAFGAMLAILGVMVFKP